MVAAVRADTHWAKVKTAMGFDRVSSASVMEAKPGDDCRCLNIATEGTKSAQTLRERDIARLQCVNSCNPAQPARPHLSSALSPCLLSKLIIASTAQRSKTKGPVPVFVCVSGHSMCEMVPEALQTTARQ